MSHPIQSEAGNKTINNQDKKKKQSTYWERVIYGKGTVSEPWPTAEELWNDPKVKRAIKEHNAEVHKRTEVHKRNES